MHYVVTSFVCLFPAVEPFKIELISETILHRLLDQDIIFEAQLPEKKAVQVYLYQRGKQADFFTMVLQGRVEVTIGKENIVFEQGPFSFIGQHAPPQPHSDRLVLVNYICLFFFLFFFFTEHYSQVWLFCWLKTYNRH